MSFGAFVQLAGTTGLAVIAGAAMANYNFQEEKDKHEEERKAYEEEKKQWR